MRQILELLAAPRAEQPEDAVALDGLIQSENTERVRAAALACPVGTVRSGLHRAKRMLAEKLDGAERRGSVFARLLGRWA